MTQSRSAPIAVTCLVVLLGLSLVPHIYFFGASDWERVYIPASERLLAGENIFQQSFVYPPFAAILGLPSVGLDKFAVNGLLWSMNLVGVSLLMLGGWSLAGGRFQLCPPWRELLIAVIGLATAFGFTLDVMVNRQTDLLIGGLLVWGCWQLMRGRETLGAAAVGLASAVKLTPLLLVPYLAWVGKWRLAVVVAGVTVTANLAVDVAFPPRSGPPRLVEWGERFLLPQTRADAKPGDWHADIGFNHSLAGAMNRLSRYSIVWQNDDWQRVARGEPSPWGLRAAVYGSALLLLCSAAVVARRRSRSGAGTSARDYGMVICLMLLLSPMSSKPHFCVLVLPAWTLARSAVYQRRPLLIVLSILAAMLGLSANKDLLGDALYSWAIWHGAIPLAVLVLFVGQMLVREPAKADE